MSKRLLLIAAVATCALLAAGCSGDDSSSDGTTPTTEWANGLCTSITTWKTEITTIVTSLKGGDLSKDSLAAAVDDADEATRNFTSDLKGLGRPDTDAGQQLQDSVNQLTTQIDDDMQKIQDTVSNASGVAGVLAAVPTITTTIQTAANQVADTISGFQDLDAKGELESAFDDAEDCKAMTAGS
jgi:methyl-accepting chemotaxis protein